MSEAKKRYVVEDFLEKYMNKTSDLEKMAQRIEKLNRIYAREAVFVDEDGNIALKSEANQRVCNFFIYPTHKLYYDNGDTLQLEGLAVKVYTRLDDERYKCVYINLNNEMIEKGDWINADYLDYDFDLPKPGSHYSYVRTALKVATRRIGEKNLKIFDGENWMEDDEALDQYEDFMSYFRTKRLWGSIKPVDNIETDVKLFLDGLMTVVQQKKLIALGEKPVDGDDFIGWEAEGALYLSVQETWKLIINWITENKHVLNIEKKIIHSYLMEKEIIESEVESSGRKRHDVNKTLYPGNKKRVLVFRKSKVNEFLNKQ